MRPDKDIIKASYKYLNKYQYKFEQVPYSHIYNAYSGRKKRLYYGAAEKLKQFGFDSKDAIVNMFIKPDRWPEDIIDDKPPRAIQFRRAEYNLKLSSYLKPLEEHFVENFKHKLRVCAKGLNLRQRAELFMRKTKLFKDPVFVNIDHSKFDSTVNLHHLKTLHKFYRRTTHKSIYNYLKYQYKNICYTKGGIKYIATGTRMSGDFDTGLGNTIINIMCLEYVFRNCDMDYILDGDDAVVIMDKTDLNNFNFSDFSVYGFDTKLSIVRDKYKVDFCQCRLMYNNGWIFSRNPIRAISNQCISRKSYNLVGMMRYVAGVGQCELHCSAGVPVLQAHALQMVAFHPRPILDAEIKWKMRMKGYSEIAQPVSEIARITFERAWDIPIGLQYAMEQLPAYVKVDALTTFSGVAERIQVVKHNAEQLYRSWTLMGAMGSAGG